MKLKTYYSDYTKMQFKKQLWIMGLVAFVMFLALPIALVIEIGNMEHYGYTLYESQKEFKMFMLYSELILLLVMCSGFLIAIYQFRYLHSKRMALLIVRKEFILKNLRKK